MIKNKSKIYNLGGLQDLLIEQSKYIIEEMDEAEYSSRITNLIQGKGIEKHKSLNDAKNVYWNDNLMYYTEIIDSFERMFQTHAFLCKFPKYGYYNFYGINELSWLRYHIEYYLQENYILEQRTLKWIKSLKKIAKNKSKKNIEQALVILKKKFEKGFKDIRKIRGKHVHEFRYDTGTFVLISSLNLVISKGSLKRLAPLRNLKLFEIKEQWLEKVRKETISHIEFYDELLSYFRKILVKLG